MRHLVLLLVLCLPTVHAGQEENPVFHCVPPAPSVDPSAASAPDLARPIVPGTLATARCVADGLLGEPERMLSDEGA